MAPGARAGVLAVLAGALLLSQPVLAQTAAQKETMARANELLQRSAFAQAYQILAPLEDELAGNIDFDYMLGVAALDSGRPDKATIAFERVIATNPNFAGARLDMGRAYFQLGDLPRARAEFETVLRQDPPEAARKTVEQYLATIAQAERAQQRSLRAYVEGTLGYDSNVNFSTTQSNINLNPAIFGPGANVQLTANNVAQKSGFGTVAAGAEFVHKLAPRFAYLVGADWRKRDNFKQDTFDYENREVRAGVTVGEQQNQLRVIGSAGRYYLDAAYNRNVAGIGADWRYTFDPSNQINVFTQYSRTRFTDAAVKVNSYDAATHGIGGLHVFGDGRTAVFAAYYLGKERDTDGRADGSKSFQGGRAGGQYRAREDMDLFASLTYQESDFGRQNLLLGVTRKDKLTDFSAGLNWRFLRDWTLRPALSHSRNDSNLATNWYKRTEVSVTVRRDFDF
ncbi:MAG: tetratricopeptide repeat protein [Burkholderiales bacterium]|nr:tetratricopeptide repeat protein [Burkholderiales bacterium]